MLTQRAPQPRPLLSVVVAVYNAAHRLETVVSTIDNCLKGISYELILVDDASRDKSWETISMLATNAQHLHTVRVLGIGLLRNIGQHMATFLGLMNGRGRYLVTMDDDLQHQPHYIHQLLDEARRSGAEAVYGTYHEQSSWGSKLLGGILSAAYVIRSDCSSFRLLSSELVDRLRGESCGYLFLEALIARQSRRISSCALRRAPRHEGPSSYSFWSRSKMAVRILQEFTYIFIWIGGILSVLMIVSRSTLLIWTGISVAIATLYSIRKKRGQKRVEDHFLHIPQRTTNPIDDYENNLPRR